MKILLITAATICSTITNTEARIFSTSPEAWNPEVFSSAVFGSITPPKLVEEEKPEGVLTLEQNVISSAAESSAYISSSQIPKKKSMITSSIAKNIKDTKADLSSLQSSLHLRSMDLKSTVQSTAQSAAQVVSHRAQSRIALASYLLQRRKRTLTAVANYAVHKVQQTPQRLVADCRSIYQNGENLLLSRLGNRMGDSNILDAAEEEEYTGPQILTSDEKAELSQRTTNVLASVKAALVDEGLWQHIVNKDGVNVWKTNVDVKNCSAGGSTASSEASEAMTVRSEALMDASPRAVCDLFMDDARVHEYNENCVELADIERINSDTKINWCATGKFGPFKARDFVTVVYFRELTEEEGGGYVSLAANVEHPNLPPADGYVRSEIQLAATFMKPVEGEPNKTKLVQMTQVGKMGGVADSAIAKRITQNIAEKAPVDFMKKFNHAVTHPPAPQPKRGSRDSFPSFIGVGSVKDM